MNDRFASALVAPFLRMRGVFRRHYYLWIRNPEYFFETFWQPVVDVLMWGFISYYLAKSGVAAGPLVSFFLSGIVLFAILRRGQHEVTFSFMEEAWSRNLQNILMTPVRMGEYFLASVLFGLVKLVFEIALMGLLIAALFRFNVLAMGVALLPFSLCLLLTGWSLGLVVNAAIIYFGRGLMPLSWIIVFVLQPFSCVFYPMRALPAWAHNVAIFMPPAWVFEGMRAVLSGGVFPWKELGISLGLNLIFLALAYALFSKVMSIALDKGLLTKLEW